MNGNKLRPLHSINFPIQLNLSDDFSKLPHLIYSIIHSHSALRYVCVCVYVWRKTYMLWYFWKWYFYYVSCVLIELSLSWLDWQFRLPLYSACIYALRKKKFIKTFQQEECQRDVFLCWGYWAMIKLLFPLGKNKNKFHRWESSFVGWLEADFFSVHMINFIFDLDLCMWS